MMDSSTYNFDNISKEIDKFVLFQLEQQDLILADIIQNYDFIVGSIECKHRLMKILPEGANIIYSRYIESPTMIYAIKKFDIEDLL